MKSYHSIPNIINYDVPVIAFNKFDGSNIRAEISTKKGFYKFGSRNNMLPSENNILNESIELIQHKYEEPLIKIFEKKKYLSCICYFEFYGENSTFGQHINEEHMITMFDIDVYKKGFILPSIFINEYSHLDIPKIIFNGYLTENVVNDIKNNNNLDEGVVCKSDVLDKFRKPIMFKIKTHNWLSKLKDYCKNDEKLFNELK